MNATSGLRGARRKPADLERDSDAIRADMDRTIEAIESKFSPARSSTAPLITYVITGPSSPSMWERLSERIRFLLP